MQGKFPSVARHVRFLTAAVFFLSAALHFREHGNAKKCRACTWKRQLESCTRHCTVLLVLSTGFRGIHFVLLVDFGFIFRI